MTLRCHLFGCCFGVRERRTHDAIPAVLGTVCARCGAWQPLIARSAEERANVMRKGFVRLPRAKRADQPARVLPMRRTK